MTPRPMLSGRGTVAGVALAALLCERARLVRRQATADELLREHAALREVAALVAQGGDLAPTCGRIAHLAADLLCAEVGLVLRFEAGRGILVGRWVRSLRDYPDSGQELPFEPGSAIGQVQATARTARVAAGAPSPFRDDLGERVASPILLAGRLWGAVGVAGTRAAPLPARAPARLESFAELVALAIGNAEARAQLVALATTDPLTALANRRAFEARFQDEFERAARYERPLSLLVFDVDRFKSINDRAGHLAGDEVLSEIAQRLSAALRCDALLGRLGGDEFAAVLPECDAASAALAAQRARHCVSARAMAGLDVTVSVGVAAQHPGDATPEELFRRADAELYRAKQARTALRVRGWRDSSAA